MARDFITVTRTSSVPHGQTLLNYVNALRSAYEQGVKIKALMDHNTDGSVWTDIETMFGVPTGKGQAVYNLVAGSVGAMAGTAQSSDGKTLTEQVG